MREHRPVPSSTIRGPAPGAPCPTPGRATRLAAAVLAGLLGACNGGPAAGDDAAAPDAPPPDADLPDTAPAPDAAPKPDAFEPPPGSSCATAIELGTDETVGGDTEPLPDTHTASCSAGSSSAPDAVYRIEAGETPIDITVEVEVDEEAEEPYDVVLHARAECGVADSELGCADARWGERLELLEVSEELFIIVDGTHQYGGERAGAYTLRTASRAIAGADEACDPEGVTSRCAQGLRCVAGTCAEDSPELGCAEAVALDLSEGAAEVTATTYAYEPDHHAGSCAYAAEAGLPEHIYRFELTAPADVVASTDFPETDFDTYLYIREADCEGPELGCHDDVDPESINLRSHLELEDLAAGTYYLFVDGSSDSPGTGHYKLRLTAQ